MEYHEGLKALAKGAKLKESVRTETDTIYRDTTIYVAGETLDETFSFVDRDTVPGKSKEGVEGKLSIDSRKKTGAGGNRLSWKDCEGSAEVLRKPEILHKQEVSSRPSAMEADRAGYLLFPARVHGVRSYHRFRRKPAP